MREEILSYLSCPSCGDSRFDIDAILRSYREIVRGKVYCSCCGSGFGVEEGILDLLPKPSKMVRSEQAGWLRLLGETTESLVDTMLELPYLEDDIWVTTCNNFEQVLAQIDFRGKSVLDIGAGRCWSTRHIVLAGASYALSLDVLRERFIGLETAEIYFEHDDIYFDRVLADMHELPTAPEAFDIIFMTATLHRSYDLPLVMGKIATTLKPNGLVVVINEPVCSFWRRRQKNAASYANILNSSMSNAYSLVEYVAAFRSAGFEPVLQFPDSTRYWVECGSQAAVQEMGRLGARVISLILGSRVETRIMKGALFRFLYLIARMPLFSIATKT